MRFERYQDGHSPYHPHPPLDAENLMRLFGEWIRATNDDRYTDGAGLLREMEERGVYVFSQRKGRPSSPR